MTGQNSLAAGAAARLTSSIEEIAATVQGLPAELITWIPAAGVWSIMDILCHIREFVPFWTAETLRITRQPDQQWGRDQTDPARLAAVADTSTYMLDEVIADLRRAGRQSADRLHALSDDALAVEATSVNPRWGRKPASFVVEQFLVQHVEKHLGQVRRNVTQFDEAAQR